MEEPNQIPNPNPNPPNTSHAIPPPPPPLPANIKKRPLENGPIQNSNYFKMRAILKEIRPHFIEVLQTPDFQNCKAAQEIREQMKHMMDLYKEMMAETISITKCMNNIQENPQSEKLILRGNLSEKQQSEEGQPQGTFIVGGSAFGWNFITYPSGMPVFYGRTKEMFRSANVIPNESAV